MVKRRQKQSVLEGALCLTIEFLFFYLLLTIVLSSGCGGDTIAPDPVPPPAPLPKQPAPQYLTMEKAAELINKEDMEKIVRFLASEDLKGRGGGTLGHAAANKFIAHRMTQLKLAPKMQQFQYRNAVGENIYCVINGKTPRTIVLCAHCDGQGQDPRIARDRGDMVRPSADDNASGVALILELMEALSSINPPQYTYLFYFFDFEEYGLIGSDFAIKNHPVELQNVKLCFNVDMCGRYSNNVYFFGGHRYGWLKELIGPLSSKHSLSVDLSRDSSGSDHVSYSKKNIASIFIHTGIHPDYHTAKDTPDKINYVGMEQIGRMSFELLTTVDANQKLVVEQHVEPLIFKFDHDEQFPDFNGGFFRLEENNVR